ncbi:hypothetical protein DFQ27_000040 [Actinomortierella ambigua]|uniref:Large-conductance mechanosensitive channel n=1 Tax=Actinomortierella ambigua TaxID=1343610 RepID=A0A9P6QK02_9FUNG|nr:hypothetical protein DFQ26_000255 [Actinomortierella ambigua]KAG0270690.1 hypothetical protein DFQ27_000040 [Actinomortierella ambigua]
MSGVVSRVKNSSVWTEFKEFINRGSIIELGVGIIIGGAFASVINSFVSDILTPFLGLLVADSNLQNWFIIIRPGNHPERKYKTPKEAQEDGAVTENVGAFLMTIINFLMVAISLFLIVFIANRVKAFRKKVKENRKKNGIASTSAGEEDETAPLIKPDDQPASGVTRTCPWCSANVPVRAVKCMYCTSYLHEKVPATLLQQVQPDNSLVQLDG